MSLSKTVWTIFSNEIFQNCLINNHFTWECLVSELFVPVMRMEDAMFQKKTIPEVQKIKKKKDTELQARPMALFVSLIIPCRPCLTKLAPRISSWSHCPPLQINVAPTMDSCPGCLPSHPGEAAMVDIENASSTVKTWKARLGLGGPQGLCFPPHSDDLE